MSPLALSDYVLGATAVTERSPRYRLWIDRVGAFLVCLGDAVTIGGPASDAPADVSLLANLSRRHVTLARSGERYVIYAHAPVHIGGRPLHERADLCDGHELQLGSSVRLRFRLPSVMSGSARLEFLSDHRPAEAADAVILMHDTCLLGPTAENHVLCPGWPQSLLLYRQGDSLCCKSREDLFINGRHAPGGGELASGSVVTAAEIRFRLETIP